MSDFKLLLINSGRDNMSKFKDLLMITALASSVCTSAAFAEDFSQLQGTQSLHEQSQQAQATFKALQQKSENIILSSLQNMGELEDRIANNQKYMDQSMASLVLEKIADKRRFLTSINETLNTTSACKSLSSCNQLKGLKSEIESEIKALEMQNNHPNPSH